MKEGSGGTLPKRASPPWDYPPPTPMTTPVTRSHTTSANQSAGQLRHRTRRVDYRSATAENCREFAWFPRRRTASETSRLAFDYWW